MAASDTSGDPSGRAPGYLYYDPATPAVAEIADGRLRAMSERHKFQFVADPVMQMTADILAEVRRRPDIAGVIVKLEGGIPPLRLLRTSWQLRRRAKLYYFWPAEGAIEVIDDLRLRSLFGHWTVFQLYRRLRRAPVEATAAHVGAGRVKGGGVVDGMRSSLATIDAETAVWRANAEQLVGNSRALETSLAEVRGALDGGSRQTVATGLESATTAAERIAATFARTRLAMNRTGYCFEDLAKASEQPEIVGLLDPAHLRGLRQALTGAVAQASSIEGEFTANLPGMLATRNAARGLASATTDAAAPLGADVRTDVEVVLRVGRALTGYGPLFAKTAADLVPHMEAGRKLVADKLAERETQAGATGASVVVAQPSPTMPVAAPAVVASAARAGEAALRARMQIGQVRDRISPVPFVLARLPDQRNTLPGTGLYLRTDYWAPTISGGSYGHTCYQARALARTTERFHCLLANRFPLLDDLGLKQTVVRPDGLEGSEASIIRANDYYLDALRPALDMVRPAYLFERACLGNFIGAKLSQDLKIPYIVEYNGSEISMRRSFDGGGYDNEALFLEAEDVTFRQASLISVVSEAVKDDLVKRGLDGDKIIVNWNAVDPDAYAPPPRPKREALRAELGFAPEHRVVCFIGTFGGWHGIEVLASAMPAIVRECPDVRFLLIGDGGHKKLVHEAIAKHGLGGVVRDCGRVAQAEGARLMGAADIFVSPHSSHMVDSRFFGSPTKLFEYLAYGVGVVASDLEQIGDIMRPSLMAAAAANAPRDVGKARGVLCRPGDVDQFVAAVTALARQPELVAALGHNARIAAKTEFTWDAHVAKLWRFVLARQPARVEAEHATV